MATPAPATLSLFVKHPRRRERSLLGLLLIVTVLVASLWLSRNIINEAVKDDHQESKNSIMHATYVKVSEERKDVTRYAAVMTPSEEDEEGNAQEANRSTKKPKPMSIRDWMTLVSSDSVEGRKAASDLSDIIASSPYSALLFETPGSSYFFSSRGQFRFALVDAPTLQSAEDSPDTVSFAEHFRKCPADATVCSFGNLGKDAILVAPTPQSSVSSATYSHLAAFVRGAPKEQVVDFWRMGAQKYLEKLKKSPNERTWFSTNGMGVSWLHLRLDDAPKYYSYGPFKA
eukprot:CAMPEP_0183755264 /NCGR_PEP_ID=MMETSP0739-20130205/4083_1 /TAXON_ID=385413 /ORGANISM="Thalassiosira miniscula, Strain CCMP1093" /LENGTH=286 /DNA_ID=CAMNT_0025992047 /DNA_START=52 /DNA_END=912 /DNA_ORIENTATION=-